MSMYDLLEYSDNYSMAPGSLQSYYRDDAVDSTNEKNNASNYRTNNNRTATAKV